MHWSWLRLATAVVGLSGVVAGYIVNVDRATRQGQDLGLVLANYFSLFTIITTILTATALTVAAVWSLQHRDSTREPFGIALGIAVVTGPMMLLGVVFNVLLRGAPSGAALTRFAGDRVPGLLRHRDAACGAAAVPPRRPALRDTTSRPAVVDACGAGRLPAGLDRLHDAAGELTPDPSGAPTYWYPYPFLDPHGASGWTGAFTYIGVLLARAARDRSGRHRHRSLPRAARPARETETAEVPALQA